MKHSWPRRSGRTGAAIMRCVDMGLPYYSPLPRKGEHDVSLFANIKVVHRLEGLSGVVVDDYEHCSREYKDILATMSNAHIFGTFGSDADDYKIPSAKQWAMVLEDVDKGLISLELALREFNLTSR